MIRLQKKYAKSICLFWKLIHLSKCNSKSKVLNIKKIHLLVLIVAFVSVNAKFQTWGDSSVKHRPLFYSVEKAPKYPGGMHAFYQFIADNLQMPENKFSVGSNKLVNVRIVINENGKVVFAEIEKV